MAIDTATKRRAVSGIPAHPLGPGVTPDSSQGRAWRAQSAWGYYQVAASDMVVEVQLANLDSDADADPACDPDVYDPNDSAGAATNPPGTSLFGLTLDDLDAEGVEEVQDALQLLLVGHLAGERGVG